MSELEIKATECEHCWHRGMSVYTSLPPQYEETCCHCGTVIRRIQAMGGELIDRSKHGPFAPVQSWF